MLGVTPHELTCIPSKGNVSIPVLYAIKSMELACALLSWVFSAWLTLEFTMKFTNMTVLNKDSAINV